MTLPKANAQYTADANFTIDAPVFEVIDSPEQLVELLQDPHKEHERELEITDQEEPLEIEITIGRLPGAPDDSPDPQPMIEINEEPISVDEKEEDTNDAVKNKNDKWNWSQHGSAGFIAWIKERSDSVPKHSGTDTAGLERAQAYLEKLDGEISKAMRMDLDEELDANQIEKVRAQIDDGINRLHERLDKIRKAKRPGRRKKAEYVEDEGGFIKEAQKITGVQGIVVTVPLFISSLARTLMNGMVSAGHDAEEMYIKLVKKWKLSDREQLELRQCLFDMGLPMRIDMGVNPDEDIDVSDGEGFNWATNYTA